MLSFSRTKLGKKLIWQGPRPNLSKPPASEFIFSKVEDLLGATSFKNQMVSHSKKILSAF